MKIDKQRINSLLALENREMWEEIKRMAEEFGYTLPSEMPKEEDMERLRTLIKEADKIKPLEALRLLSKFKAKRTRD